MKRPVSVFIRTGPALGRRSEMLYGHFIEQEDMETMQANAQDGRAETVEVLDVLGTRFTSDGTLAFAAVNKDPFQEKALVCIPALTARTAGGRSRCGVKAPNPIMTSGIQKWN